MDERLIASIVSRPLPQPKARVQRAHAERRRPRRDDRRRDGSLPRCCSFPSIGGRSHDISEDTDEADIRRGLRVLAGLSTSIDRSARAGGRGALCNRDKLKRLETMRMIGVDVGGTFTDIVYCDMASGRGGDPQGLDHAGRPVARNPPGHEPRFAPRTASRPNRSIMCFTAPRRRRTLCSSTRARARGW